MAFTLRTILRDQKIKINTFSWITADYYLKSANCLHVRTFNNEFPHY
jgi:hypothetical protein